MSFIPRTANDWTLSLARPLFIGCITLLVASVSAGFGGGRVWHYCGTSVACVLLPILGVALGLTCLLGSGLSKRFKTVALIVAVLALALGPTFAPALAE